MTCRDIMTENPTCCVPSDSAARAAQIMRSEDIGPVLVVNDHGTRQLVGIITDRDLAINVVAAGLDPNTVCIGEVMSRDLITCGPSDDIQDAMASMGDHQVRRIPVVDDNRCLVGIIAQADLARCMDEESVGDIVEDISEPAGFVSAMFGGRRAHHSEFEDSYGPASSLRGAGSTLLPAMIGLGLGAGLMYLLDPNNGRRRRAKARDRAVTWSKSAAEEANRKARDIGNRAAGMMAEARSSLSRSPEDTSDEKLVERVRSKIGHIVSHAHSLDVTAQDGNVCLRGPILASELDLLIQCVGAVEGVRSVDNRLEIHDSAEHVPALQGGRERSV